MIIEPGNEWIDIYGAKVCLISPMSSLEIITSNFLQIITIENKHIVLKETDDKTFQTEFMSRIINIPISDFLLESLKVPVTTILDEQQFIDLSKIIEKIEHKLDEICFTEAQTIYYVTKPLYSVHSLNDEFMTNYYVQYDFTFYKPYTFDDNF